MREECINDVLSLLSSYLFKECNDLAVISLGQIHNIINILVKANIPFTLTVNEGTRRFAKTALLTISVTPTFEIRKIFQFEEGRFTV
ncbi:hypothetical protein SH1V18_19930 [Vallitalea longa]|uniref:Uncharacterized protein n=1 Tax=Vallitalea longa TaxID=2936439 RepID=A0A9W5YBW6_9FIRM|nr:hypothetical protein [Vallitalea longa]GKX29513.1 hypothetical protein SH1V18_19930 [Vallitalea longa]